MDVKYMVLLGIVTLVGYYAGNLVRMVRLPSLIGYMMLGVVLGSPALGLFNEHDLVRLTFITEITLGFVAFLIGAELSLVSLKRQGFGIVAIIFASSFAAFFVVLAAVYILTRDMPMALIFAAMAPASAPAGTVAVIQENRARGSLTKAIYAVVGFDDGLAILIFGLALALAKSILLRETLEGTEHILMSITAPLIEISSSLIVGGVFGFLFSYLAKHVSQDLDYFILVVGFVLIATGLSKWWPISLILTNMVIGFVLVNTRRESLVQSVIKQLKPSTPFFFILFFFLAGAHLNIKLLMTLGPIGVLYLIGRSIGKISGAHIGAIFGNVEEKVKKYIGISILCQAGVAIGLSLIVKHEFSLIGTEHAEHIGTTVITTITATSIFFEIVGPILTKIGLEKAKEIPSNI